MINSNDELYKLWIKSLKNLIKISNKITTNGNNENLKETKLIRIVSDKMNDFQNLKTNVN